MTNNQANKQYAQLLADVSRIAIEVAAVHAGDVDTNSRFPLETVKALKQCKAFSAPIPVSLGGADCNMRQLASLCSILAQACGSSAMVLAMHYIQVACLVRHGSQSTFFQGYLKRHRRETIRARLDDFRGWYVWRNALKYLRRRTQRWSLYIE